MSPTETEAVVQKMKRGRGYAPGYTPSILVNESRVVVGQDVDPTNETVVIPGLLKQAREITGHAPEELLLDGGYCNELVITTTLEQDISLLCSTGKEPGLPKKGKRFQKTHFRYHPDKDVYICPAHHSLKLTRAPRGKTNKKPRWVYSGAPCQDCPLKSQCTTSKTKGRSIIRYAIDEEKEALREVMSHPAAKKVFRQRKAMVEPVFGYLRNIQGLNRFRRKGLKSVKLEFSLHLLAYNMSRAVMAAFYCAYCVLQACILSFWAQLHRVGQNMSLSPPINGHAA